MLAPLYVSRLLKPVPNLNAVNELFVTGVTLLKLIPLIMFALALAFVPPTNVIACPFTVAAVLVLLLLVALIVDAVLLTPLTKV